MSPAGTIHAGAKPFCRPSKKRPRISRPSTPVPTIPPSSSTRPAPRETRRGALHAHRVLLGHLLIMEMAHDFLPKPGDLMWTPADWAWIGGLFDALFPAWYHGVPMLGHRAKKFEPLAEIQLMADHGVRNVLAIRN